MQKRSAEFPGITSGNAAEDGYEDDGRGWFVGHFIDAVHGPRHSDDLEVKWGQHRASDERTVPGMSNTSTTLTLLIKGHFVVVFPDLGLTLILRQPGDYVIFKPQVAHVWKAIEESVVVTVRWPSAAEYHDQ